MTTENPENQASEFDVVQEQIKRLASQINEIAKMQKAERLNYEAEFSTIELAYRSYRDGDIKIKEIKKPGVLRDFKGTDYLVITWKDGGVTAIDKAQVDQYNLDRQGDL